MGLTAGREKRSNNNPDTIGELASELSRNETVEATTGDPTEVTFGRKHAKLCGLRNFRIICLLNVIFFDKIDSTGNIFHGVASINI